MTSSPPGGPAPAPESPSVLALAEHLCVAFCTAQCRRIAVACSNRLARCSAASAWTRLRRKAYSARRHGRRPRSPRRCPRWASAAVSWTPAPPASPPTLLPWPRRSRRPRSGWRARRRSRTAVRRRRRTRLRAQPQPRTSPATGQPSRAPCGATRPTPPPRRCCGCASHKGHPPLARPRRGPCPSLSGTRRARAERAVYQRRLHQRPGASLRRWKGVAVAHRARGPPPSPSLAPLLL